MREGEYVVIVALLNRLPLEVHPLWGQRLIAGAYVFVDTDGSGALAPKRSEAEAGERAWSW